MIEYTRPVLGDVVLFNEEDFVAALLALGPMPDTGPNGYDWHTFVEYSIYEGTVRSWSKSRFGDNVLSDHFHPHFVRWQAQQRASEHRAAAIRSLKSDR